jgi:hypothetical protein
MLNSLETSFQDLDGRGSTLAQGTAGATDRLIWRGEEPESAFG